MDLVKSHCNRHISGITDVNLYKKCYTKTKNLIHDYIKEHKNCLEHIFKTEELQDEIKERFFSECL